MMRFKRYVRETASLGLVLMLSGCQSVPTLGLPIYRIDIQQGNVVTQDMVRKLQPGMTRQQVRFILGTPPVVDPFRTDRWDYVYYYSKGGKVIEHRRLVLYFDADTLKRIEGDVVAGPTAGKPTPGPDLSAQQAGDKPQSDAVRQGAGSAPQGEPAPKP